MRASRSARKRVIAKTTMVATCLTRAGSVSGSGACSTFGRRNFAIVRRHPAVPGPSYAPPVSEYFRAAPLPNLVQLLPRCPTLFSGTSTVPDGGVPDPERSEPGREARDRSVALEPLQQRTVTLTHCAHSSLHTHRHTHRRPALHALSLVDLAPPPSPTRARSLTAMSRLAVILAGAALLVLARAGAVSVSQVKQKECGEGAAECCMPVCCMPVQ